LVLGGLPESDLIAYIPESLPRAQTPGNQALFSLLSEQSFFPVLQDQDSVFIFNALFTVEYVLPNSPRKRDFRFGLSGSSFRPGQLPRGFGTGAWSLSNTNNKRSLEQAAPSTLAATTARVGMSNRQVSTPSQTSATPMRTELLQQQQSSSATSILPSIISLILATLAPLYQRL